MKRIYSRKRHLGGIGKLEYDEFSKKIQKED